MTTPRLIKWLVCVKTKLTIQYTRKRLKQKEFTIISQNCIGGVFYHDVGIRFMSPTINLYFNSSDFMKFVLNMDYYLSQELAVFMGEKYPVGRLDDISIFFQHYTSCEDAKKKWEERKQRINKDCIIVLSTDRDGFGEKEYEQWKRISLPKVLFSSKKIDDPSVVWYPEYQNNGQVMDLIPERKFYKNNVLLQTVNNASNLNNGE